jgi:hypothetical protein
MNKQFPKYKLVRLVRALKYKSLIRAVCFILILLSSIVLTGCGGCGGFKLWGGEYCDNLFTPNWDNRHAKFVRFMNAEVGKPFPTLVMMCSSRFERSEMIDKDHTKYVYSHRPGCTYYCVVDSKGIIVNTSFEGTKETCWQSLN